MRQEIEEEDNSEDSYGCQQKERLYEVEQAFAF